MELHYKDYYLRTIQEHNVGLKLVLGGTGLGKTFGYRQAVTEYLTSDIANKKKCIYITNRHNLIAQQVKQFRAASINCCYLKNNREIIIGLLESNEFSEIVSELEKKDFFKYDELLKNKHQRTNHIKKLVSSIGGKLELIESQKDKKSSIIKTLGNEIDFDCNELFKIFKSQMILISRNEPDLHQRLLANKFVWKLFPYVGFENNPDANILLVTIHKVLMGFFDGKKDIKIASIENKIIFLDEFDFLEQEILKILCDEPTVINPLEFVRIFYEKFKHWSKADFWNHDKKTQETREKFNEVINFIEDQAAKKGITFPQVVDFRVSNDKDEKEAPGTYLLFQTNEIITPRPFFLHEKDFSWFIQLEKTKDTVSPYQLFNILAIATNKILGVFHYYLKDVNHTSELIQTIWNQKNDNTAGRYENYINENCLYHRTKSKKGRDHEAYKDKSPYEIGFRLVRLAKRINSFDPASAELSQIELFTSPEAVIAKLADTNLVFGLSATADIHRTLKCFNVKWLERNANFIPIDDTDRKIIKTKRDEKAGKRQATVNLKLAEQLSENHPLGIICKSLHKNGAFDKANDVENSSQFRYERILKIFNSLYSAADGNKFSHLMFVTTFDDLSKILDYQSNSNNLLFANCDLRVFSCKRFYENNGRFFRIRLNGKDCSLFLLDAKDARRLEESKEFLETFKKCFNMAEKAIVITQYKSASNGINLPCFPPMGDEECDFQAIHLLEENHFWFDSGDDATKFKNFEKQALWYLWKLKDDGQIYSSDFKSCLNARDPRMHGRIDINKMNRLYKNEADEKILNSIALFHQSIGRIERRDERVGEVEVVLDAAVFRNFYDFVSSENFADMLKGREEITSSLILKVHEAVLVEGKKITVRGELGANQSFLKANDSSKQLIRDVLDEISKVNKQEYDPVVCDEIKESWLDIRDGLLKHEFHKRIDIETLGKTLSIKRDLTFETKLVNANNELFVDVANHKIYKDNLPTKKLATWNIDLIYTAVRNNPFLLKAFNDRGYKTKFESKPGVVGNIPTPYTYQAILAGAVGEAAISLILEKEGVKLNDCKSLHNQLFEVFDAKVNDRAIYFDFKNFGTSTLDKFAISLGDMKSDPDLNSMEFLNKLKAKFMILKEHHDNPIIYVLNLYSQHKRKPDFFDSNFKPVDFESQASIRIIPSILNSADLTKYSPEFESTLKALSIRETENV